MVRRLPPAVLIPAIVLLGGIVAYPFLPTLLPMHSTNGVVDNCAPRAEVALAIPLALCALGVATEAVKAHYRRTRLGDMLALAVILVAVIFPLLWIADVNACT